MTGDELEVKLGNVAGASFRVRYPEAFGKLVRVEGNVHAGTIAAGWKRIACSRGTTGSACGSGS
jgi:hypothetical protein